MSKKFHAYTTSLCCHFCDWKDQDYLKWRLQQSYAQHLLGIHNIDGYNRPNHDESTFPHGKADLKSMRLYTTKNCASAYASSVVACDGLYEKLPHGSGINGNWHIRQQIANPQVWECMNTYSAMEKMGGYCHDYDFTVKVRWVDSFTLIDSHGGSSPAWKTKFELISVTFRDKRLSCCGHGLDDYLNDLIAECFTPR